jgi:hypothetical protein
MNYEFQRDHLLMVTDHAAALDIVVVSLSLTGDTYRMSTDAPFPPEQLAHLGLTEV